MTRGQEQTKIKIPTRVYKEIEENASRLLRDYGDDLLPIDVFELARRLNITLIPFSQLKGKTGTTFEKDGCSLCNNGKFTIYYNDDQPIVRQKFTIMHEIGHIRLGHKTDSDLAEQMANHFASYALVPLPLVYMRCCKNAKMIEEIFGVSLQCAQYAYARYEKYCAKKTGFLPFELELIKAY